MIDEMDNVIEGPWSTSSRLPLDDFLAQAEEYRTDIVARQHTVLYARDLFSEGEAIWPDQCNHVINTIRTMSEPVQEFCGLLDSFAHLPVTVGPLRSPLMKALYHVDELVNELTLLLTLFRSVYRTSSRKVTTQRQEIQRKLESLVQSLEEIDKNVDTLPERIDFQEQILSRL